MRQRLAPNAVRTAISLCRPLARASMRFATFAHAISKLNPTAGIITQRAVSYMRTVSANIADTGEPQPLLVSGNCCSRRAMMLSIAAGALWIDEPDFNLP